LRIANVPNQIDVNGISVGHAHHRTSKPSGDYLIYLPADRSARHPPNCLRKQVRGPASSRARAQRFEEQQERERAADEQRRIERRRALGWPV
jgi:hypothetical protein